MAQRPQLCADGYCPPPILHITSPEQVAARAAIGLGTFYVPHPVGSGYVSAGLVDCYNSSSPEDRAAFRAAFPGPDASEAVDVYRTSPYSGPNDAIYYRAWTRAEAEAQIERAKTIHTEPGYRFWIGPAAR